MNRVYFVMLIFKLSYLRLFNFFVSGKRPIFFFFFPFFERLN